MDFSIPEDLRDLLARVRTYVHEDALPAEAGIADPEDVLASWHVVERLRDLARERGLYTHTPHLEEWGGLGVGVLGMALISGECGANGLASPWLNADGARPGQHAPAADRGRPGAARRLPRAARRGLRAVLLGHDRARRRLLRPDEPPDHCGARQRRVGPQRPQVLHHRRGGGRVRLSEAFGRIADGAAQMHGAAGIAMDPPIARIYQDARAARIYDGASEVHRMTMVRECLKLAVQGESTRAVCGELG